MAILELFPKAKLGVGPVIENGFYYDFELPRALTPDDLPRIEAAMRKLIGQNLAFKKKEVKIAEAIAWANEHEQPYKAELLADLQKYGTTNYDEVNQSIGQSVASRSIGESIRQQRKPPAPLKTASFYTTGTFRDLCRGPHVISTKDLNPDAFKLTRIAGAYWRGSENNPQLTRIYGVAFSSQKELGAYLKQQEEVEKRDHRKIGAQLELFAFHDVSPGSAFWLPRGMTIWKELERFMREELLGRGYDEISTPILVKKDLWIESGHWDHYRENMFLLEIDKETYSLKPMNCPESTFVYRAKSRSWRDLPLRLAEITGKLHRNELSGALGGLFRVRQLAQDDAHIYCRPDQILDEVTELIRFAQHVYKTFGFTGEYRLATKPDQAMGDPKLWKRAEAALAEALKKNKIRYTVKPKDGAFYGPKIDGHVKDALGREWQLSTIQLDFQMPERFGLEYTERDGKRVRPVMIHRALLGSFERFIGTLLEHTGGNLPVWLSPTQVSVIPITDAQIPYAKKVFIELQHAGIRVELQDQNDTVGKKIRNAELMKIPYMLIAGAREVKAKTVAVRDRTKGDRGPQKLSSFIEAVTDTIAKRT